MSDQSPLLSLPLIQAAQAQKHITHNEAIERLDMLVQLTLDATNATTPPVGAIEGQAWAIGSGATGAWLDHIGSIAAWRGGGWLFVTPLIGWRAWDKSTATVIAYDGTDWIQTSGGGTPSLQNLTGVGINAASDATNRLTVSAPATLLNHEGAGHQLKLNKAAPAETASLLYQSNWSGRAEMGLAGDDDFAIKVSADGTSFIEALHIDAATGVVSLPATPSTGGGAPGSRQLLPYQYRYYLYTDKRWTAPSSNTSSFNAAVNLGNGANPNIYFDGKGAFLPAGTQIHQMRIVGNYNAADVADMDMRLYFQTGAWNGNWINAATTTRVELAAATAMGMTHGQGMSQASYPLAYTTATDGYVICALRASASSTNTSTRYFYCAGMIEVTPPA